MRTPSFPTYVPTDPTVPTTHRPHRDRLPDHDAPLPGFTYAREVIWSHEACHLLGISERFATAHDDGELVDVFTARGGRLTTRVWAADPDPDYRWFYIAPSDFSRTPPFADLIHEGRAVHANAEPINTVQDQLLKLISQGWTVTGLDYEGDVRLEDPDGIIAWVDTITGAVY